MAAPLTAKAGHATMEAEPCRWRWGSRLQLLLLGSMLYAALTLSWTILNVHTAGSQGESASIELETVWENVQRPMANTLQKVKDRVEDLQRTPSPEELAAVAHARSVPDLPSGELRLRNLTCIGWRATGDCKPDGPRQLAGDLTCEREVPDGSSGYCEVQDVDSGELFRVMRRTCAKYKRSHVFRCADAQEFVNYHVEALNAVKVAHQPGFTLPNVRLTRLSNEMELQWWCIQSWLPARTPQKNSNGRQTAWAFTGQHGTQLSALLSTLLQT